MLNKYIGKTIKAAKKSARQMYGYSFLPFSSDHADEIPHAPYRDPASVHIYRNDTKNPVNGGVRFERSTVATRPERKSVSPRLEALREYARRQELKISSQSKESLPSELHAGNDQKPDGGKNSQTNKPESTNSPALYSRANIRSVQSNKNLKRLQQPARTRAEQLNLPPEQSEAVTTLEQQTDRGKGLAPDAVYSQPAPNGEQELTALHSRIRKLENLLDRAEPDARNTKFHWHPVCRQLVDSGIDESIVQQWFEKAEKQQVDPQSQPGLFTSRLASMIESVAGEAVPPTETKKFLLFTGLPNSGKSHLIRKLSQQSRFSESNKTGIASMLPVGGNNSNYNQSLQSFCQDRGIRYRELSTVQDFLQLQDEWRDLDHILVDTPSTNDPLDWLFGQYWVLQQLTISLSSIEVHYVIDASDEHRMGSKYYRQSLPIDPDYLAFTHLNESKGWGTLISVLNKLKRPVKYLSTSHSISKGLEFFDPQQYTQQLLHSSLNHYSSTNH
jgi:flagellar biosynthesis GTPase FlhF